VERQRSFGCVLGTLAILAAACAPTPRPIGSPPPLASTAAAATASAAVSPAPTPQGSLDRIAGWQADIRSIVPGLERIHPNPFHGTSKADMDAAAEQLADNAPTLSDDALLVGVTKLAALVSAKGCDGHTGLFVWGTGTYPVDSLPLRLWLFGDDVVIVDALPPFRDLIQSRITAIDENPIADVRAALDPLIPRDNDQTVRLLTPRFLLIPEVLRGLALAGEGPVRLRLEGPGDAVPKTVEVAPIPMADYNAWAGPYGLHLPLPPDHSDVLALSRIDDALWSTLLPDGATLYIQYNRVDPISSSFEVVRKALHSPDVQRVVLDIRNNTGGEVGAVETMLGLFTDPTINQPGKLFVITGRNTFSAASMLAARLDSQTDAIFIGEPMSGCPTSYGDPAELALPNTGLSLLVADMLEVASDPNDTRMTIPLDAEAELSQDDWAAGEDPAIDLVRVSAP
jgi:hypothetical protein